jgi:hypothetical protein
MIFRPLQTEVCRSPSFSRDALSFLPGIIVQERRLCPIKLEPTTRIELVNLILTKDVLSQLSYVG